MYVFFWVFPLRLIKILIRRRGSTQKNTYIWIQNMAKVLNQEYLYEVFCVSWVPLLATVLCVHSNILYLEYSAVNFKYLETHFTPNC